MNVAFIIKIRQSSTTSFFLMQQHLIVDLKILQAQLLLSSKPALRTSQNLLHQ